MLRCMDRKRGRERVGPINDFPQLTLVIRGAHTIHTLWHACNVRESEQKELRRNIYNNNNSNTSVYTCIHAHVRQSPPSETKHHTPRTPHRGRESGWEIKMTETK